MPQNQKEKSCLDIKKHQPHPLLPPWKQWPSFTTDLRRDAGQTSQTHGYISVRAEISRAPLGEGWGLGHHPVILLRSLHPHPHPHSWWLCQRSNFSASGLISAETPRKKNSEMGFFFWIENWDFVGVNGAGSLLLLLQAARRPSSQTISDVISVFTKWITAYSKLISPVLWILEFLE